MLPLNCHRHRRVGGFTLIELLVVVAIIGIVAVLLVPNLLDSLQKSKQKRTVADMRDLGAAWFSWLTDQVAASAAGASQTYDINVLSEVLTAEELLASLYINDDLFYIRSVPRRDGWGHYYDFRWSGVLLSEQVIGIRSFGRDGQEGPTTNPYPIGPFLTTQYDQDIIWSDGLFITYPTGVSSQ